MSASGHTNPFSEPPDFRYPAGEKAVCQISDLVILFNGKDLTGWGYLIKEGDKFIFESFDGKTGSNDKRFRVINGSIVANPDPVMESADPKFINIWTEKDYNGDFRLSAEFRASKNADSGIFIRGVQLQCRDYILAGPYKNLKNYKAQDWNKIEVVVKDNIARCTCNGEILEEGLKLPATGRIGLEADRGKMEYRNIQINEIK